MFVFNWDASITSCTASLPRCLPGSCSAFQTHFQGWTHTARFTGGKKRRKWFCSTKKQPGRPPSNLYEDLDKLGFALWRDNTQLWGGDSGGWWKINYTTKKKKIIKMRREWRIESKKSRGPFKWQVKFTRDKWCRKGCYLPLAAKACTLECEEEPWAVHH